MTIAAVIKLITFVESILLGVMTLRRGPESRRHILFSAYLFIIAVTAFVEYELCRKTSFDLFVAWKRLDVFTYPAIALMFHFALEYTGLKVSKKRGLLAFVYGLAAVHVVVIATVTVPHAGVWQPWGYDSIRDAKGDVMYRLVIVSASIVAMGTLLLFATGYRRAKNPVVKRQIAILFIAHTVLVGCGIAIELVFPLLGVTSPWALSATSAFLVVNPFFAFAIIHYDVLKLTPASAAGEILQIMSDGLILLNREGRIDYVNPSFAKTLGTSQRKLRGKRFDDIPIDQSSSVIPPLTLDLIHEEGDIVDAEYLLQSPGEQVIPVSVSASRVSKQDNVIGYIVTLRDISHRKEVEETRDAADRIMRHDLRNSLTGVLGFAELMAKNNNLSEFQQRAVENIQKISETMMSQIESYLSLQKMENGSYQTNTSMANLVQLTREVIQNLETLAKKKSLKMEILYRNKIATPKTSLHWRTEPTLFYSVLSNLVKNAIEASPEGGTVSISMDNQPELTIEVHNRGIIPESIRPHFFSKFVSSGKKRGTGLGAYSAKLITEALGGTIEFETDDNDGTSIFLTFPKD